MTGAGPARGRQPVRTVPVRARSRHARAPRSSPASRAPARCWWKCRRWWRRPRSARRAARWSAGTRAGCRWCWRCWRPIAACKLSGHDVYLNVAGGLRIQEPAADLAAAAALVSSLANAPLPADAVYFGEISLSGAVRPVAQTAARLKEAQKLGFARAMLPEPARAEGGGRGRAVARSRSAAWRAWSPTSPRKGKRTTDGSRATADVRKATIERLRQTRERGRQMPDEDATLAGTHQIDETRQALTGKRQSAVPAPAPPPAWDQDDQQDG